MICSTSRWRTSSLSLSDPLVEDTHHIDRVTGRVEKDADIEEAATPKTDLSLLVDETACETRGTVKMMAMDRADGGVTLTVSTPDPALVFLSEPYYPERRVWVDGEEGTLERVNMAFSGVRVGPGLHVVELRFVPMSFYMGDAVVGRRARGMDRGGTQMVKVPLYSTGAAFRQTAFLRLS